MNASIDFLIDSNILVYAHDPSEREKQRKAIDLLDRLRNSGSAALSVQSLSEFFSVSQRRLKPRLKPADAAREVEFLSRSFPVLSLVPTCLLDACRVTVDQNIAFWDALIWAVAKLNQVRYLLSEDGDHGRFLEGVRWYNPFLEDSELARILP